MNDNIYYLIHGTNDPDCVNWKTLMASDDASFTAPGTYFTLINKYNIKYTRLYENHNYIMIFSRKLLLQQNYYITPTKKKNETKLS